MLGRLSSSTLCVYAPLFRSAVSSTSGPITLTSGGAITETGTLSTTGLLTPRTVGGGTISQADTVGSFTAINTSSGNVSLTNAAAPLTITAISETGGSRVRVN